MKVNARSHCKESLQGVIARSHCKESLQRVIARSHCKESLQGVIARSHCKESLQGVIARSHCKESLQGVIAKSHESHCELQGESSANCKCMESSASCKCMESSASCKCMESSATTLHENRPTAGIGVVEVQQLEVFCDFCGARATLCGDRRGRGATTRGFFAISRFFGISAVLAQPSAGIGVVEERKQLSRGSRACSRDRRVAGSIPLVRGRASQDATCILKQLAQSNLRRASCICATCADQLAPTSLRRAPCLEQLAQSNLRRATCTEQLAQSSLHRATCRERNLHRATCREPLAGTNLPEQLARSNLRRATCTVQLA